MFQPIQRDHRLSVTESEEAAAGREIQRIDVPHFCIEIGKITKHRSRT